MSRASFRQYLIYLLLAGGVIAATPFGYQFLNRDLVLAHQGRRYFKEHKYALAAQTFAQALETGEASEELLRNLGDAAMASGDFPTAVSAFQRLARDYPENLLAVLKLAELLALQGRTDQALEQVDAFLARRPQSRGARVLRGRLLTMAGRFDEAIDEYGTVLEPQTEAPNTLPGEK